ncbi:MAG: Arm DNA-binding domain-containing protein [Tabrizicola sp.]|jgi:hypothetical protein|nr:Arm DNA-binding domain-containing protein [Tabrizicola sp.]
MIPKLTKTIVSKLPFAKVGTQKHRDSEVKGLVLSVGKASQTVYFQKDAGGQTRRVMIGSYPSIFVSAARETTLEFMLVCVRGACKSIQIGASAFGKALCACGPPYRP